MTDDNDCPICYGENALDGRDPICPNGHRFCADCQPIIQRSRTGWGMAPAGRPRCPLCRADIPGVPAGEVLADQAPYPGMDRHAGGEDALGRRGGGRPHNGPEWNAARRRFIERRQNGEIPHDAMFGGIHHRKCGNRQCDRTGGSDGVRFLLFANTGKRRYRCEVHDQG